MLFIIHASMYILVYPLETQGMLQFHLLATLARSTAINHATKVTMVSLFVVYYCPKGNGSKITKCIIAHLVSTMHGQELQVIDGDGS